MVKENFRISKTTLPYYLAVIVMFGVFIAFISQLFDVYITRPKNKRRIKENAVIVNGAVITEINNINKVSGAYMFTYSYYVESNKILSKHSIGLEFKSNSVHNATNYLMESSLPVIFEKGNPKNSRLLIAPKDFDYFEIPFPDSLLWIKEDVLDL